MKTTFTHLVSLLLLTGLAFNSNAQTVTTNPETWSTLIPGGSCNACTITIPTGDTLNITTPGTCTGCTFKGGGTVNVKAAINFPTSVTTFSNLTINFTSSVGTNYNLSFTNDSVLVNAAISWANGTTEITNSKFGVNAKLSFQTADLISDSFWINNNGNIAFSNSPDSIKSTFIEMSDGSNMSFKNAYLIGSTFIMNGNAAISVSNNLYDSLGTLTMNDTSSLSVNSNPTFEKMVVNLNDTSLLSFSNTVIFGTGTDVTIGGGSLTGAHIKAKGLDILGNSMIGIASSKYSLTNNNASFNNDGGSAALPAKTITGCATLNNSGYQTCVTLAVANIELNATDAGAGKVALSWSDNETTPADHYLVQRYSGDLDWSTIATIPAGGYSNAEYHFTDEQASSGTIEYRIVRVDADGKTLYSSVSAVTVTTAPTDATVSIYPNPAIGSTFYVTTSNMGEMIVNVYTITGQLLLRSEFNGQKQYAVHLPSQALLCGTVVVQTITQGVTRSFTVLVR